MFFRKLSLLFFSLFLLTACPVLTADVEWYSHDIEAAKYKAREEGKLIYIFVEGSNCPPCDSFKFNHLSDPVYVDFVNSLFVPIRCHVDNPSDLSFLESLGMMNGAVPRFYALSEWGDPVGMSIGTVRVSPMGPIETLRRAAGKELPVNQDTATALAKRIREYAARERKAGALYPDGSMRDVGIAAMEAWAWALAGNLDEAEKAWGADWVKQLEIQDLRYSYSVFWSKWKRNPEGTLAAARDFHRASPTDPAGTYLLAIAMVAGENYEEAVKYGEELLKFDPNNYMLQQEVEKWRQQANAPDDKEEKADPDQE